MGFKVGDTVKLRNNRSLWTVLAAYQRDDKPTLAVVEPQGEAWNRNVKVVPMADLTLCVDLETLG